MKQLLAFGTIWCLGTGQFLLVTMKHLTGNQIEPVAEVIHNREHSKLRSDVANLAHRIEGVEAKSKKMEQELAQGAQTALKRQSQIPLQKQSQK